MSVHRSPVALAALIGGASSVLVAVCATQAGAHGAPTDPASRAVACGPRGDHARSAACVAAVRAGGATAFAKWDNLRVADVAGRDRLMIPDRQLCSAGIDLYKELDAARDDWPATSLKAGAPFTLTYASTIPHRGTFRVYLTKDGYDPGVPLRWDDLENEPVASVTDPELRGGVYRVRGALPKGREGRHVLYTVWQNSDTPDTYYSCSDVVLSPARPAAAPSAPTPPSANPPTAAPTRTSAAPAPARTSASGTGSAHSRTDSGVAAVPAAGTSSRGVPVMLVAGLGALAVAAAVTGAAYARRRHRV
ncbi:lytic polysaccharide monooxygenase [Streptomyces sp. SCSIO 30461]|uniref:lytic polysaccharide monooxygenase auxiliary activity family 9 protein n=1 Tax=Streptomyces sp. SCSIO 30461 TaxID=3118085 RepID=UPI0030CF654C